MIVSYRTACAVSTGHNTLLALTGALAADVESRGPKITANTSCAMST